RRRRERPGARGPATFASPRGGVPRAWWPSDSSATPSAGDGRLLPDGEARGRSLRQGGGKPVDVPRPQRHQEVAGTQARREEALGGREIAQPPHRFAPRALG